jgi:ssDNA-binding Zn-finger/Zn-ribbon topoisomerase 1
MSVADDWLTTMRSTMRDAVKLKAVMVKKNLYRAKAKCPECEGHLVGTRSKYNGHISMICTGPCKRQMME